MGVMVDLEEHCFPPATTLSEGGVTWERVSPFLVILVPSSCSSSATVWVSCEVDLGGLVFSVAVRSPIRDINCRTGHTGPDRIDNILSVKVCQRSGVGLTLPSLRSNW